MNINSILDRINTVIRGRFSANGGAAWINWTSDVLDLVERECPGTGQHVSVMAYPMDSGFIPKPASVIDITRVSISDQELDFTKNDLGVWPELLPDTKPMTKRSMTALVTRTDGTKVSFVFVGMREQELIDAGVGCLTMNVNSISAGVGSGTLVDGIGGASLDGYKIKINDEFLTLLNTSYDSLTDSYTFECGTDDVAVPFSTRVVGFSDGFFDGWAMNVGNTQIIIYKSKWVHPILGDQGWSTAMEFTGSLMTPCRPFTYKNVSLINTNVFVGGYSSINRPTSLTDDFPISDRYAALMAAGLEMKAQIQMDPSSSDAKNCSAIFQQHLMNYRIDQSQSRGKAAIRATNSNPRLGRKNRGW